MSTGNISVPYGLYTGLSTTQFLLGTPLNLLCLIYFLTKKKRSNSRFLYLCINGVDAAICCLGIFTALSSFYDGAEMLFGSEILCALQGMLSNITQRLSVFLIAVLSISRTISLACPLKHISRHSITLPVFVYTVLLVFQATMPYWFGVGYNYSTSFIKCGWGITDLAISLTAQKILFVFLLPFQFLLPLIAVLVSGGLTCVKMLGSSQVLTLSEVLATDDDAKKIKKQGTITVVFLTAAYAIFNIPNCAMLIIDSTWFISDGKIDGFKDITLSEIILIGTLLTNYTVVGNSITNAVIYICRIKKLRHFSRLNVFISTIRTRVQNRVQPAGGSTTIENISLQERTLSSARH